ncbi:hypothetical protein P3T22_003397 [Paraburkholderia sp. GAS348]
MHVHAHLFRSEVLLPATDTPYALPKREQQFTAFRLFHVKRFRRRDRSSLLHTATTQQTEMNDTYNSKPGCGRVCCYSPLFFFSSRNSLMS